MLPVFYTLYSINKWFIKRVLIFFKEKKYIFIEIINIHSIMLFYNSCKGNKFIVVDN